MSRRSFRAALAASLVVAAAASVASAQFVVTPLRLEGQSAPGGGNFQGVNKPNMNDSGVLAFTGDTDAATTADSFLIRDNTLLALEGQPATGVPAGIYGTFASFDTGQQLNATGNIIFNNALTGVPTTENTTLFTHIGGVAAPVAREGTASPGVAGRLFVSFSDPGIFDNNNFGFQADLDGGTTDDAVIYRGSTPIHREGTQVSFLTPGIVWDSTFDDLSWNGQGVALFVGGTNEAAGMDSILVRDINGTGAVIAREGDAVAATAGADTISLLLQTQLSQNGKWIYRGNLDVAPATSDAFIKTEFGFYKQEGDAVSELPGVNLGNFNDIDMDNAGNVLYLADLIGAADPDVDEGLFFNNQLVLTDGSPVPGLPNGEFSDLSSLNIFLNETGQIVFRALYTDGVTANLDGLFAITVPEPTSIAVVGLAAAALMRRRRVA